MKIQENTVNNNVQTTALQKKASPSFKSGAGVLNTAGYIMQGIENQGFWLSFLIQDCLGMTLPRVGAGFLRDKEVTGQFNVKEGFEVLGREGLTGPCMMAVAPIGLAVAALFGRSTSVNSKLIRRFGNNLKEIIKNPNFDEKLLKNKEQFKNEFYRQNIKKILSDSLGEKNVTEDVVNKVLSEIKNYENIPADAKLKKFFGKSKYRSERMAEVTKYIDDLRYKTSDELGNLQTLKVSDGNFSIQNTFDAMIKYSDDAIRLNKNLDKLDEAMAENIKNTSVAKRFFTNIALMASTLGVLAVLPKIYAKNSVPPGAQTAELLKQQAAANQTEEKTNTDSNNVSFKARPTSKPTLLSKLGDFISKTFGEKMASEFEYNGNNFTPTLMAGLSIFGLLGPRGIHAYQRAPKDKNGKKDLTEIWEILIRDITSSLAVVFLVPMGTRALVTSYENKTGFVLMNKDRTKPKSNTYLDLLNPYSKAHVLTNAEIGALYNGVDSIDKMNNFCKYIDKNGGDLQKILSKSDYAEEAFKRSNINLKEIAKLSKEEKNKKIIEFVEKLGKNGNKAETDNLIKKLMQGVAEKNPNKIAAYARGLNSIPGLLVMCLISPFVLGWFIPRLTYANTRKLHAKANQEYSDENNKINTAV